MNDEAMMILWVAIAVLAALQAVLWMRVTRLRRRAKRPSLLVGPEDHIRLQKQLYSHVLRMDLARRGITPRVAPEFRAEWGEDTLLYDLFEGTTEGAFVEVGALDGYQASITYVFEAIGWRGLLVEPIPERASACKKRRAGSHVVHAALAKPGSGASTTFMVPLSAEAEPSAYRQHEGMGTGHLRALESAGAEMRPITVPLTTMDAALAEGGFEHVDFVVLDVEGAELDVLRGFDLERFRPRVLIVEENSLGRDQQVVKYLERAGYVRTMWIAANGVYVRASDSEMRRRAERLASSVYSPFVRPEGLGTTDVRLAAR
jgi:FkbM family methyltransferase